MPNTDASLIITNARVLTADPALPSAEAVAVCGERIAFVGSAADAKGFQGSATRLVDAQGCTLMPGIIDSHYHLLGGSLRLDGIQLGEVTTAEQLYSAVLGYARAHPELAWLPGYGLRYGILSSAAPLTRQYLDTLVAGRPLLLFAFDGHTAWANTRALELGGVLYGNECGPNSEVVLAADGMAAGELREPGAFGPLRALIPPPDAARKRVLLRQGLAEAARYGITSIHNMDGDAEQLALYQSLEEAGELALRIYLPYSVTPATPPEALAEAVAMRAACGGMFVRAGSVKFFMDGVIEGYTGLLLDDYADRPGCRGEAHYSAEHFAHMATEADRLGLQCFVHAIGDAAVRRALDGFEAARRANGPRDSRHRVEHIELIHAADLPRFAALGVIASMQPHHAPVPPDYGPVWLERVGNDRWNRSFAWEQIHASGAHLVFGSDWPVVSQNPLLGMGAVLNRLPWSVGLPNECLALDRVLAAYTRDAAFAGFQEHQTGMLRAGMDADLTLLDADIANLPPEQVQDVGVTLTVCAGRVVYER